MPKSRLSMVASTKEHIASVPNICLSASPFATLSASRKALTFASAACFNLLTPGAPSSTQPRYLLPGLTCCRSANSLHSENLQHKWMGPYCSNAHRCSDPRGCIDCSAKSTKGSISSP